MYNIIIVLDLAASFPSLLTFCVVTLILRSGVGVTAINILILALLECYFLLPHLSCPTM